MSTAAAEDVTALGPRLLREVLRTPAFREVVQLCVADHDGEAARQAVHLLFQEGIELPLELGAGVPAAVTAAAEGALQLGEQLASLPQPLLDAFLSSLGEAIDAGKLEQLPVVWGPLLLRAVPLMIDGAARALEGLSVGLTRQDAAERAATLERVLREIDGVRLGQTVNAVSRLVLEVSRHDPDLTRRGTALSDAMDTVDFGKLRCAVSALSSVGVDATRAVVEKALSDPLAVSNILVALPPLINGQLTLLTHVFERLDLPEELLASAVFAFLEDVDAQQLGRVVTAAARLIGGLHRGSLLLGNTEPAFRGVCRELVERFLSATDMSLVARALVALGEDGEVVADTLAQLVRREPKLVPSLASTLVASGAPLLRGSTSLLREVNQLPDSVFREAAGCIQKEFEVEEAARLVGELAAFLGRCSQVAGGRELAARFLAALPQERVVEVSSSLAAGCVRVALGDSRLRHRLGPEEVGRRVNELVARFNRYMEEPASVESNYLRRLAAVLDPEELERAWRLVIDAFLGSGLVGRAWAKAVVRPVVAAGWQAVRLVTQSARPPSRRKGSRRAERP